MIDSPGQSLKTGTKYLNSAADMGIELDPLSDNALMIRVRDGELEKLGLLFERYKKLIFSYFFNLSKDRDLSEDLVQTVFMRVMKYKHAYRGDGSFRTWIFHIARNVQADQWKKDRRMGYKVSADEIIDRLADEPVNHEKEVRLMALETALSLLPEPTRELLVLTKLKGMKYREIGQMMNWTESNVKIKVFRALKALKEQFEELDKSNRHG